MHTEQDYYLAWSACPQIGPIRFQHLLKVFGSAKFAWEASETELRDAGAGGKWLTTFLHHRQKFDFSQLKSRLKEWGISFLCQTDVGYPKQLKEINKAPIGLYVMNNESGSMKTGRRNSQRVSDVRCQWSDVNLLAVVGTRKITSYGRQVTRTLTQSLVDAGLGIVSGLMYGVDETAHRACVEAGGYTVGVWAGGLDTLFKGSRKNLAETVLQADGALVSEFPLGLQPSAQTFPYRNRIVAGMSCGVLVTEGSDKSGTLITAGYGAEQGKEVFAVPGPITSQQSAAPSQLIKAGAKLVTSVQDILDELPLVGAPLVGAPASGGAPGAWADTRPAHTNPTTAESQVLDLLRNEPLSLDQLSRRLKLPASELGSSLSMMELKGWVGQDGGQWGIN